MGYSGAGVVLAMLDTGFYKDHEAFADAIADGRLLAEWDFINDDGNTQNESGDDLFQHFHGTATWSAAGGFHEGELIGPAYGASFLLAKTEDVTGETPVEEDNWAAAAEWADLHGADVISSSLGYLDWYTYEDMDGDTAVTTIAADIAVSRGIAVCNSAGNEGNSDWYYIIAPADGDSVIAVGAVNVFGELAGFSSHGPTYDGRIKPDVLACGDGTYCAYTPETGGTYGWASGTSLSCPLVAGAAALILEARPQWSPTTVREALRNTADHASSPDNDYGWGIIDVPAAIDAVLGASESFKPPLAGLLQVRPNPLSSGATLSYLLPDGVSQGEIAVFDGAGRRIFARPIVDRSGGVTWDGRDEGGRPVPSGVYLVRLRAEEWRMTQKAVVRR
jgi:subtilisin family serine protease